MNREERKPGLTWHESVVVLKVQTRRGLLDVSDGVLGSFLLLLSQLHRVVGGFGDGVPGVATAQDTFCLFVYVRFWVT
jgi:hypothetical protein